MTVLLLVGVWVAHARGVGVPLAGVERSGGVHPGTAGLGRPNLAHDGRRTT
jgi:hypothetical protein